MQSCHITDKCFTVFSFVICAAKIKSVSCRLSDGRVAKYFRVCLWRDKLLFKAVVVRLRVVLKIWRIVVIMLRVILDKFWNEDVWLPPNTTWEDLAPGPDKAVVYNDYRHLLYPLPLALVLIVLRRTLEEWVNLLSVARLQYVCQWFSRMNKV